MKKTNILITGTGSLIGQAVIKSIYRSTLRDRLGLVGCDYFENTVGSYWCDRNYILPDLLHPDKLEAWKAAIIDIVEKEQIKVLFIGVDFELEHFADLRGTLKEKWGCTVIVSDRNVIDIGNDKYKTYQFLSERSLYAPATSLLEDVDEDTLVFPVVLKPRHGARSRGVHLISGLEDYKTQLAACCGKGYIVQEAVGSMDTEYTCGILYWDETYQNSIILKRTLKEGNTATAEFCGNQETQIKDYIRSIGDVLKPFGSCNLQLRTGADGTPYLFEINPRFSGTTYMRALFGYNEVAYILCKVLGWEPPQMNPKEGKVYRFYEERLV